MKVTAGLSVPHTHTAFHAFCLVVGFCWSCRNGCSERPSLTHNYCLFPYLHVLRSCLCVIICLHPLGRKHLEAWTGSVFILEVPPAPSTQELNKGVSYTDALFTHHTCNVLAERTVVIWGYPIGFCTRHYHRFSNLTAYEKHLGNLKNHLCSAHMVWLSHTITGKQVKSFPLWQEKLSSATRRNNMEKPTYSFPKVCLLPRPKVLSFPSGDVQAVKGST